MSVTLSGAIWMLDDNVTDLLIIERCLRMSKLGNPFRGFLTGDELAAALADVQAGNAAMPALLLLDINMPDRSGFETLLRVRTTKDFGDFPLIIMLTGSDREKDQLLASQFGADGFKRKSSRTDEIVDFFNRMTF